VCNFSVATTERWMDRAGQRQEATEWHRCVVFGKLAEICGRHLVKGKQVAVTGRLQTREWEDKDGNKKSTTEIVVRDMEMLGDGRPPVEPRAADSGSNDDIPF